MSTATTSPAVDHSRWGGCRPAAFVRRPGVSLDKTRQSIAAGELRAAINAGMRSNNLRALQLHYTGL